VPPYGQPPLYGQAPPPYGQVPPYGQAPYGQLPPYGQAPPPYGYPAPPLGPIPPVPPFTPPSDPLISADYGGWIRRNVALVKAYWRPLALLQLIGVVAGLVLSVPAQIIAALGKRELGTVSATADGSSVLPAFGKALPAVGVGVAGSLLASLVTVLVTLAGIRLLVVGVTGGRTDIGDALKGALGRLLPLVGWGLVSGLIMLVGLCVCLLPGIYAGAVFLVLPAVVLFERGDVIGRCFRLFHADLGATLARVATIAGLVIAVVLVSGVFGVIVNAVTNASTAGSGALVGSTAISAVFDIVVGAAIGVVLIPLILTTYADERARVEPLHTGILAAELTTT
jgi:hypothetical protein